MSFIKDLFLFKVGFFYSKKGRPSYYIIWTVCVLAMLVSFCDFIEADTGTASQKV